MIIEKLSKIEAAAKYNIYNEYRKIETITGFKELLNQIDFSTEVVPIEDNEKLTNLLTSLKGKQLSSIETKLVKEIVEEQNLNTKEIKKCFAQLKKDYPGAAKQIRMLETKLFLMRLEDEIKLTD